MLLYSDLKKMVLIITTTSTLGIEQSSLYKGYIYSIRKMSDNKQFPASRCAASLLLIITIGKQQPPPSPQLLHRQYYFLEQDDKEGQEHEKEEEVGKQ